MPYIPHTKQDIDAMLATIGITSVDELFSEIPKNLRINGLSGLPEPMNEMEISRLMRERFSKDRIKQCYIGAGAYEHYIPAVVWDIVTRSEMLTAYTPYQAEGSQGTLQFIYEYQSMMCQLCKMDVSNASMYDGASALAEAVLMAMRLRKDKASNKVLVPHTLHPRYLKTVQTITKPHAIEIITVPFQRDTGTLTIANLTQLMTEHNGVDAIVINQPNFFGVLEDVDTITDWAHKQDLLVIAVVNPLSLAMLKPPGAWGTQGADIVVGDGQPLGAPLSSGGPYFGFMCCKKEHIRQIPGRIVGKTTDTNGKMGFVLTMQAREQHIRRAKATSNICSNQALMASAATVFLSLLGDEGLRRVAATCHKNAELLRKQLVALPHVTAAFSNSPFFHEFVVQFDKPVTNILAALEDVGILGGHDLIDAYPELGNALLVCATETKTTADMEMYIKKLAEVL
jgi:glycine dehydrogenase subunit 1